jgi:pyruvate oxidase
MVFGRTVADVVAEKLVKWGVKRVYGIPGDAINTIMDAIRRSKQLEFILVRHEEAGALAASAEAKLSGKLAACVGTAGPGAIHLLNGLYEAKTSHVPVVALTGQVDSDLIGTEYFQEVDLLHLFSDVSVYNQRIASPGDAPAVIEAACRNAVTRKGVAHLSFPLDLPRKEVPKDCVDKDLQYRPVAPVPSQFELEKAAETLNSCSKIVVLAGGGSKHAREELLETSKRLGAPISVTLPGKGAVPDLHPLCLGGLGLIGTRPSQDAMDEADAVLMVGTNYPYTQFLPSKAKMVQVDTDPDQIGKRVPVDVALLGDSKDTLRSLVPLLKQKDDLGFLKKYQDKAKEWWRKMDEDCRDTKKPIRPQVAAKALQEVLPKDAIVCVDVGNVTVWIARYFAAEDQTFIVSPWLGTMGVALPSALAAKLTCPDRAVAAFAGDGGFTMLMGDFNTAVKYDLPILTVVVNNGVLGMIKFEQEVMGHPEFGIDLHNPNYAEYAKACGGYGVRVTEPDSVKSSIKEAYDSGEPSIVEIIAERNERPMPPRIKPTTALHYATALFREKFE